MPVRRVLLALLVCGLPCRAAELRTLKGETVTGDLVSINDKEIVLAKGAERVATPLAQVLQVDFGPAGKPPAGPYTDVELTDGSLLHCHAFAIKGKDVELQLLPDAKADQVIKLPLKAVANVLRDAHVEKNRKDWNERLGRKRRRDVLAVIREGVVNAVEGTLGEADAEGTDIEFALASGAKRTVPLANVHGLIFQRELDPNAAPVVCKVSDTSRNLLQASAVVSTPAGLEVTTPAGAKLTYPPDRLARLDYSGGKLAWLSDLEPAEVVEGLSENRLCKVGRDVNINGEPIRLDGVTYARGLSMLAPTEVVYDLKGEYRQFKAVVGIDDQVGGSAGPTVLRVEADGKELATLTFDRRDKPKPVVLDKNIKDVQKLRITVTAGDIGYFGKHLDLADAKVSK
jgi:hypothetical protein